MWEQAAIAGFGALGDGLGGSAPPSTAIAEGSTVTVGGLNVPAYPNFPLMQTAAATQQPTVTQAMQNNDVLLAAAVGLVVVLVLVKKRK
jgi:hypothetical protein